MRTPIGRAIFAHYVETGEAATHAELASRLGVTSAEVPALIAAARVAGDAFLETRRDVSARVAEGVIANGEKLERAYEPAKSALREFIFARRG